MTDSEYNEYRDDYAWPPSAQARLNRHAAQVGADKAALTDTFASAQMHVLRYMLAVAEAAMRDEAIHPVTARRVLDRLIYGCVPNPADAADRQARMTMKVNDAKGLLFPPPVSYRHGTGGLEKP